MLVSSNSNIWRSTAWRYRRKAFCSEKILPDVYGVCMYCQDGKAMYKKKSREKMEGKRERDCVSGERRILYVVREVCICVRSTPEGM